MNKRLLTVLLITGLFCFFLFSCATSEGSLFETIVQTESPAAKTDDPGQKQDPSDQSPQKTDELPADDEGETEEPVYGVQITVSPAAASIFFNGEYVGTGSALVTPAPGNYKITFRKEGYYSESVWATYDADTLVIVDIDLEEITGYLFLEVEPATADISINGYDGDSGVTELQIGSYTVRVRSFGYEEFEGSVRIYEKQTTELRVELEEAEFEVSNIALSRRIFSPKNPGKLGTTRLSFDVSSWGEGRIVVWDGMGVEVFTRQLDSFTTWSQKADWSGIDKNGQPVPDGDYRIGVETIAEGQNTPESHWVPVTVDSTAIISFRAFWGGLSGTLYAPTPEVLPARSFQIDVGALGHYDPATDTGRYPAYLSVRSGLGNGGEVDLQGTIFIASGDMTPYSVAAGFKYRLPLAGLFRMALNAKLTYVGNTTIDTFANYTGFSAGVSTQLGAGPISLILSPDIVVSPFAVNYGPPAPASGIHFWLYGRAGILADFGSLTAGLSGAVRTTPFATGFAVDLPIAAGAEVHWLLPDTQIVLSGYLSGEFAAQNNYYLMGGGSIGIIN